MSFKVVVKTPDGKERSIARHLSSREAADKVASAATARGVMGLDIEEEKDDLGIENDVSEFVEHP